jgi:hypothetical protein
MEVAAPGSRSVPSTKQVAAATVPNNPTGGSTQVSPAKNVPHPMNPAPLHAANVPSSWWIASAVRTSSAVAHSAAPPPPIARDSAAGTIPVRPTSRIATARTGTA